MALRASHKMATLSVRYATVLFPFDVTKLLGLLPSLGYILADEVVSPLSRGFKVESVDGPVARRMNTVLRLHTRSLTLTVESPDISSCVDELTRIESLLQTELEVNNPELSSFYELVAEFAANAEKSPLEAWRTQLADVPVIAKLSKVVGRDLSAYGLRLTPTNSIPNQENWLDIRIEPQVLAPHREHLIHVIFRDCNRDEVERFARALETTLEQIVSLVEEQ